MGMERIKKLKLKNEQLKNLPLFYNFIIYNYMEHGVPHFHFNEKKQYYINYHVPEKFISKIINYDED